MINKYERMISAFVKENPGFLMEVDTLMHEFYNTINRHGMCNELEAPAYASTLALLHLLDIMEYKIIKVSRDTSSNTNNNGGHRNVVSLSNWKSTQL